MLMYGRGANSMAEQIHGTVEEAQKIIDDFYNNFPKVKHWIDKTEADAKVNGYVEDLWGRRRRLPDIQLPKYTVKYIGTNSSFNPLLESKCIVDNGSVNKINLYKEKLSKIKYRNEYNKLKIEALKDEIQITDNGGFISQAQRQCVNARIQGGAASMSKIAMRKVFDDPILREYGFKILLQIHDELIGECNEELAEKVCERLTYVMRTSVQDVVTVPFKCDGDISPCWYYSDYKDTIHQEYQSSINGADSNIVYKKMREKYEELTDEQFDEFIN